MLIKTMLVKIGADISDVTAKLNQIGKNVDDNKQKIQGGLNKISLAVGGVGIAAIKMATDFNTSMSNIATLIPEKGVKRVNELKGSIQDLAIETGKATDDIADGAYQVISAFGDTSDTVKILDTNVRAAAAGMATTTDAINLTSAVTKGYGDVTAEAIKKASDLAFTTVKLGQTTFPELANSIGSVVPVAKKLNVSQEELFGTFATFTGVTGDASKVATQFEGVLGALIKPSEDMEAAMNGLGYASGEAMIKELGFQGALEALIGTTDGTSIGIGKLITRKEGLTLAMAMTGAQSDTLKEKIGAMKDSAGAAETAFETMTTGVGAAGFKFAQAKQQIAVMMQTLGDQLAPVVANLVEKLKPLVMFLIKLIEGFSNLPAPIQTVILAIGGLAAGAAPMFKIFTSIKGMLPTLIKGIGLLKGGFLSLLSPIGLLVAALAALAIGYMKVKKAREAAQEAAERSAEAEDNLFQKLKAASDQAGLSEQEFLKLRDAYKGNAAAMAMAIKRGEEGKELQEALTEVSKEHKEEIDKQKGSVTSFAEEIENKLVPQFQAAKEKQETWIEYMKSIGIQTIDKKKERIEILEGHIKKLGELYDAGELTLIDYTAAVKEARDEIFELSTVTNAEAIPAARDFSNVLAKAPTKLKAAYPELKKTVNKVKNDWTDASQRIKDSWTTGLADMLSGSKSFKDVIGGIWGTVKTQFFTLVAQMITKWTLGFLGKLTSGAGGIVDSIKNLFGGIGKTLTGAASGGGEGGMFGKMTKSFLGGITKMAGPIGIGLLVAKVIGFKNIQKTVQDVWKAVSDNVVNQIKLIGKAIEAIGETAIEIFKGVGKVVTSALGAAGDIISGLGKGIGGLLGGLGGLIKAKTPQNAKDQLHELRLIKEQLAFNIPPIMWHIVARLDQIRDQLHGGIPRKLDSVMGRIDSVKTHLVTIRGYTKDCAHYLRDLVKNLPKAQHGAHFSTPTLALVGEVPETVIPDKMLKAPGGLAQGSGATYLQAVFNINSLDPSTMREVVRGQIAPEFIEFVRVGLGKTKLKEALL